MVERIATVISVDGARMTVSFTRPSACAHCGAQCQASFESSEKTLVLPNPDGFGVGDELSLEVADGAFARVCIMLFFVPAALFVSALSLWGLGAACAVLVGYFVCMRGYMRGPLSRVLEPKAVLRRKAENVCRKQA